MLSSQLQGHLLREDFPDQSHLLLFFFPIALTDKLHKQVNRTQPAVGEGRAVHIYVNMRTCTCVCVTVNDHVCVCVFVCLGLGMRVRVCVNFYVVSEHRCVSESI